MTIEHLDFVCVPCDRNAAHNAGTWELRATKGQATSEPLYLCDACADKIHPEDPPCGITITLQPIGGWQ